MTDLLVNVDDLSLGFIKLGRELSRLNETYPNKKDIIFEVEYFISKLEKELYEKSFMKEGYNENN